MDMNASRAGRLGHGDWWTWNKMCAKNRAYYMSLLVTKNFGATGSRSGDRLSISTELAILAVAQVSGLSRSLGLM